jgi:homoserine O-succinyltransferase
MPLCSNSKHCSRDQGLQVLGQIPQSTPAPRRCLSIGLVNNMPDAALEATERQFRSLLAAASEGIPVKLSLYALPDVPRAEAGKRHISRAYSSIEGLLDSQLDGLIVTGSEPRAANLMDEPYWNSFTQVLGWARKHTFSAIFSCLAAHAAVLELDGIRRVRSEDKYFGILDCARLSDHRILAGTPKTFRVPHSRWNGISEDSLTSRGYGILSKSADGSVDTFVRAEKSLLVFFQGHPEYEAETLLREYRRDVIRYLRREVESYPNLPASYFDRDTTVALEAFRRQATANRSEELSEGILGLLDGRSIHNSWHSTAAGIYRNWLIYIREKKEAAASVNPASYATIAPGIVASTLQPELQRINHYLGDAAQLHRIE